MFAKKSIKFGLVLALSISGLAVSACSTQNTGSRYGEANSACYAQVTTCVEIRDRGYWVTPLHHIQLVEKQVIVEKEVLVEKDVIRHLPPVTVYETPACPADTRPDHDGACIRTVTVHVPQAQPQAQPQPQPQPLICPEGTIPGYGGNGCIPIALRRK